MISPNPHLKHAAANVPIRQGSQQNTSSITHHHHHHLTTSPSPSSSPSSSPSPPHQVHPPNKNVDCIPHALTKGLAPSISISYTSATSNPCRPRATSAYPPAAANSELPLQAKRYHGHRRRRFITNIFPCSSAGRATV